MITLKQYSIKLKNLSKKAIENVKQAQLDTAYDIQLDMYANAPKDTGAYRESIMVYEQEQLGNEIKVFVGSDYKVTSLEGNTYLLGSLLENGTRPHDIYAVRSSVLTDGKNFFGPHVKHPRYDSTASHDTST